MPVSAGVEVTISDRLRPGEPSLTVRLPRTFAGELCALSKQHIGATVEIRVGCEAISRPLVREPICGGSFVVSGTMTPADAEALAARIRNGSQRCITPTN